MKTAFGWLRRNALYVALLLSLASSLVCLVLSLAQPSVGWRLQPVPGVAATAPAGLEIHAVVMRGRSEAAGLTPGMVVLALGLPEAEPLTLMARDKMEDPDLLHSYSDWGDFYARQDRLASIMRAPQVLVTVVRPDQPPERVTLQPRTYRLLGSLPWSFWGQLLIGALAMLAAGWVVSVYPGSPSTLFTALSSFFVMTAAHSAAVFSSRELALPSGLFHALSVVNHASSVLALVALVLLLANYPRRLPRGSLPLTGIFVLAPTLLAWIAADAAWWLPSPNWGSRAIQTLMIGATLVNLARQFGIARGEPRLLRAVCGTAILLLCGTTLLVVLLEVLPMFGAMPPASQALIYTLVLLSNLGIVWSTRHLRPYDLDEWTLQAFAALAGAAGVWALHRGLVVLRIMEDSTALIVVLLVCWLAYVPLYRWLSRTYLRRAQPSLEDLTGDVLLIGLMRPVERLAAWRWMLARLFNSLCEEADAAAHEARANLSKAALLPGGEMLWVPPTAGMPAVLLRERGQVRRRFNEQDRRLAQRLCGLVGQLIATREAYGRGANDERLRIADDLHDDLGAKLLSLVHASDAPSGAAGVARLAREALEEMRLSVRHLKAQPAPLADVLADWRSETVARLTAAGIDVDWDAHLPGRPQVFSARTSSQLTRVLRETVSNLIRHSGASHCRVLLQVTEAELQLELEDNGRGMDPVAVALSVGHGLANIERRVRRLGGSHRFVTGALGGTLLLMRVPLEPAAPLLLMED
ncbi:sensor histidine kinase [Ottowia testudinis]|uniref:Histidine kinase domain-containing protein n=1 Tax=Ottowia testudinis TaxID=2816950 RepID=A0A975CHA5_9BURK|nr:ATP-binding protein [Ottowia testudinis]QTD44902.1 hypothetical protein J1M35_17905 [Ottowia testudinis]